MYFIAIVQLHYYVNDLLTSTCKRTNDFLYKLYTIPTSFTSQFINLFLLYTIIVKKGYVSKHSVAEV